MVIASGDGIYKLDYNKVLDFYSQTGGYYRSLYRVQRPERGGAFWCAAYEMRNCRIEEFEEKPIVSSYNTVSTDILRNPQKTADRTSGADRPGGKT